LTVPNTEIFCQYATCPQPSCPAIVIPSAEVSASKKLLNEESGVWHLRCPQCNHQFEIHKFELKKGKVQRQIIRLFYPDFL
jgi:hypothetical protein